MERGRALHSSRLKGVVPDARRARRALKLRPCPPTPARVSLPARAGSFFRPDGDVGPSNSLPPEVGPHPRRSRRAELSGGCAPGFSGSFKRRGRLSRAPTRAGGAGPAALGRSGDPRRSESPSCDSDPGRPAARSGRGPRLAADLEIRGEGMRACLRGGKGRYMTLASRRIRSVVSSCAHMRASADKARRSSRPGDRRCLPIRRRSAPFPGSARRASQPISQGAQSHTTPPPQQQQQPQQQPLFGRDELRIRLSCI